MTAVASSTQARRIAAWGRPSHSPLSSPPPAQLSRELAALLIAYDHRFAAADPQYPRHRWLHACSPPLPPLTLWLPTPLVSLQSLVAPSYTAISRVMITARDGPSKRCIFSADDSGLDPRKNMALPTDHTSSSHSDRSALDAKRLKPGTSSVRRTIS